MPSETHLIFDDCIEKILAGQSVESCIDAYPQQAETLAADLVIAADLVALGQLEASPAVIDHGLRSVLGAVESTRSLPWSGLAGILHSWFQPRQRPVWQTVLAIFVVLIIVGGFTVNASATAIPGELLYPVKRAWESSQLTLTLNQADRIQLETHFDERRRDEVRALLQRG